MFFKKLKNILQASLLTFIIMPTFIFAYSDYIIPGGENIGIQINSKGVFIVGFYNVDDSFPGKEAGLNVGDIIITINNQKISSISDLVNSINNTKTTAINIEYERKKVVLTTTLNLKKDANGALKTGLYVKDSINGVGTLTFIDQGTKLYGALGHEILESNSGIKLEVRDGKIYSSTVTGIQKSERGTPGEKNARYDNEITLGNVTENTPHGIFGTYSNQLPNKETIKVGKPENIVNGKAIIRTVLANKLIEDFSINILQISSNKKQKTKNLLFQITDEKLLKISGGIIQGMSGSPIIQNNMIIGAVTHVVVDDPTRGYGIFITNMLEEAEN